MAATSADLPRPAAAWRVMGEVGERDEGRYRGQDGDVQRVCSVAGLTLAEKSFSPDTRMPDHAHALAHFYLVLHGACTDSHGKSSDNCEPSTLMFHPTGARHSCDYRGGGARTFSIHLEEEWLERVREHSGLPDRSISIREGTPVWLATRLYDELRDMDSAQPLAIEGLALQLLGEVFCSPRAPLERRSPRWHRRVRELLHARFAERLTLDEIAQAAGIHPDRLCHAFREQYGCSVGEYVRQLRVEFACRQLATSDTPLAEIALAAGFADQSHFGKIFKRRMGVTPAAFRQHLCSQRKHTME
jgi:AraC family transcriptional regulator